MDFYPIFAIFIGASLALFMTGCVVCFFEAVCYMLREWISDPLLSMEEDSFFNCAEFPNE